MNFAKRFVIALVSIIGFVVLSFVVGVSILLGDGKPSGSGGGGINS